MYACMIFYTCTYEYNIFTCTFTPSVDGLQHMIFEGQLNNVQDEAKHMIR